MNMPRQRFEKGSPEAKEYMDKLREKAKATASRGGTSSKTAVTLTAPELDQLARLIKAGYAVLGDHRPISQNLKKAMKRMGISTMGL